MSLIYSSFCWRHNGRKGWLKCEFLFFCYIREFIEFFEITLTLIVVTTIEWTSQAVKRVTLKTRSHFFLSQWSLRQTSTCWTRIFPVSEKKVGQFIDGEMTLLLKHHPLLATFWTLSNNSGQFVAFASANTHTSILEDVHAMWFVPYVSARH